MIISTNSPLSSFRLWEFTLVVHLQTGYIGDNCLINIGVFEGVMMRTWVVKFGIFADINLATENHRCFPTRLCELRAALVWASLDFWVNQIFFPALPRALNPSAIIAVALSIVVPCQTVMTFLNLVLQPTLITLRIHLGSTPWTNCKLFQR